MIKPVALKNRSIDVIQNFSGNAALGPTFKATRKGDVAHLAPDKISVSAVHQRATPRVILFPQYRESSPLVIKPQLPHLAFSRLAFNSFNYALLGPISFSAIADIASTCPAYELRYSKLEEAIDCIKDLLQGHNP
jgi:HprK-related kinase A